MLTTYTFALTLAFGHKLPRTNLHEVPPVIDPGSRSDVFREALSVFKHASECPMTLVEAYPEGTVIYQSSTAVLL